MKRIALAVLCLALVSCATSWAATTTTGWHPKVHAELGYGIPKTPAAFKDGWKGGLGVGGGIEGGLGKHFSLGLDVDYNHYGLNQDHLISEVRSAAARFTHSQPLSGFVVRGGAAYILTVMPTAKLQFPTAGRFAPYLKLGAGLGHVEQAKQDVSFEVGGGAASVRLPSASGNRFASSVGVGVEERPQGSVLGYLLEARWVRIATKGKATEMIPIRLGLHFRF